jgi:hypothetical protein
MDFVRIPIRALSLPGDCKLILLRILELGGEAQRGELAGVVKGCRARLEDALARLMAALVIEARGAGFCLVNAAWYYGEESPPKPQPRPEQLEPPRERPPQGVAFPTTAEEVVQASQMPQYAGRRPLMLDEARAFLDYYQSIGWRQRDNVYIRDWRLKIRKWTEERHGINRTDSKDNWRGGRRVGHEGDFAPPITDPSQL